MYDSFTKASEAKDLMVQSLMSKIRNAAMDGRSGIEVPSLSRREYEHLIRLGYSIRIGEFGLGSPCYIFWAEGED